MGYVFISYSSKDQDSAISIKEYLNRNGVETWMAPGDIPAGAKYAQVISGAIRNCACFLILLTDDAQNSEWVPKETERAVNYRKTIIPVCIDDVVLNEEFELYLGNRHMTLLKKIDKNSPEMQQLLKSAKYYVSRYSDGQDEDEDPDGTDGTAVETDRKEAEKKNPSIVFWLIPLAVSLVFAIGAGFNPAAG